MALASFSLNGLSQLDRDLKHLTYWHLVLAALGFCILYGISLGVYRLYFHELAKFPGPKYLAVNTWYETIVDIGPHDFPQRLAKIHEEYGE